MGSDKNKVAIVPLENTVSIHTFGEIVFDLHKSVHRIGRNFLFCGPKVLDRIIMELNITFYHEENSVS